MQTDQFVIMSQMIDFNKFILENYFKVNEKPVNSDAVVKQIAFKSNKKNLMI